MCEQAFMTSTCYLKVTKRSLYGVIMCTTTLQSTTETAVNHINLHVCANTAS
jgi:hypothetical protein